MNDKERDEVFGTEGRLIDEDISLMTGLCYPMKLMINMDRLLETVWQYIPDMGYCFDKLTNIPFANQMETYRERHQNEDGYRFWERWTGYLISLYIQEIKSWDDTEQGYHAFTHGKWTYTLIGAYDFEIKWSDGTHTETIFNSTRKDQPIAEVYDKAKDELHQQVEREYGQAAKEQQHYDYDIEDIF